MGDSWTKLSTKDTQDATLPQNKWTQLSKKLSDKGKDRRRINIGLASPRIKVNPISPWPALCIFMMMRWALLSLLFPWHTACCWIIYAAANVPRLNRENSFRITLMFKSSRWAAVLSKEASLGALICGPCCYFWVTVWGFMHIWDTTASLT